MPKEVILGENVQDILLKGINTLADAIKVTLGPKGRNVIIANEFTNPYITNDGATIAKEITLKCPKENVGVELVKDVALKTNDIAGDGTTTATILAQSIINEGMKHIKKGLNPVLLKISLEKYTNIIINYLKKISIPVTKLEDIYNVALISSSDIEIASIIYDAINKVGKDGIVNIEESRGINNDLEIVAGFNFESGYLSSLMCTDKIKQECILKNSYVLITDYDIKNIHEISELLEKIIAINSPLLLIANNINDDVLSTLVLNNVKGILNVVAVNAPSTNKKREELLMDLSIATGGKFFNKALNIDLNKIDIEDLGQAECIRVERNKTTIIKGRGKTKEINNRKKELKKLLDETTTDFEKESLNNRIALFNDNAAIIKVGALTDLEMKEKKYKIEDALNATKSAIKEGILPGAGTAYLKSINILKNKIGEDKYDNCAIEILSESLETPLKQLLINSGIEDMSIIKEIINDKEIENGYNVLKERIENLNKSGIIDPTLVEIVALESAVSISKMILTTDVLLVDATTISREKKYNNDEIIKDSYEGLF